MDEDEVVDDLDGAKGKSSEDDMNVTKAKSSDDEESQAGDDATTNKAAQSKEGSSMTGSGSSMYQSADDDLEDSEESSKSPDEELNTLKFVVGKENDESSLNSDENEKLSGKSGTEKDLSKKSSWNDNHDSFAESLDEEEANKNATNDDIRLIDIEGDGSYGSIDGVDNVSDELLNVFVKNEENGSEEEVAPDQRFFSDLMNECRDVPDRLDTLEEVTEPMSSDFVGMASLTNDPSNEKCFSDVVNVASIEEERSMSEVEVTGNTISIDFTNQRSQYDGNGPETPRSSLQKEHDDNQSGPESFPNEVELSVIAVKPPSKSAKEPFRAFHSVQSSPVSTKDEVHPKTLSESSIASQSFDDSEKQRSRAAPSPPMNKSRNRSASSSGRGTIISRVTRSLSLEFSKKKFSSKQSGFGGSTGSLSSSSPFSEETNTNFMEPNFADMSEEEVRRELSAVFYKWKKAEEDKHKIAHEAFMKANDIQRESESKLQSVFWSQSRQAELLSHFQKKVLDLEQKRKDSEKRAIEAEKQLAVKSYNSPDSFKQRYNQQDLVRVQKLSSETKLLRRQNLNLKTNVAEQMSLLKQEINRLGEQMASTCINAIASADSAGNKNKLKALNANAAMEQKLLKANLKNQELEAQLNLTIISHSKLKEELQKERSSHQEKSRKLEIAIDDASTRCTTLEKSLYNIALIADQHLADDPEEPLHVQKLETSTTNAANKKTAFESSTTTPKQLLPAVRGRSRSSSPFLGQATQRAVERALNNRALEVEQLRSKLSSLQQLCDNTANELESKQAKVFNLEQLLKNDSERLSTLDDKVLQLKSRNEDLEIKLEAAKDHRRNQFNKAEQRHLELSLLNEDNNKFEQGLKERDMKIEELRKTEEEMRIVNEKLKKKLKEKETLIGQLEEVGSSFRQQWLDVSQKLRETSILLNNQSNDDQSNSSKSLIEDELRSLREALRQLESENETLSLRLKQQSEDSAMAMETLEEAIKVGTDKSALLEQTVESQKQDNARLSKMLKDSMDQVKRLGTELQKLEVDKSDLEVSLETAKNEKDTLTTDLEFFRSEIETRKQEMCALRQEYKNIVTSKTKLELQIVDREKEIARLKQREEDLGFKQEQRLQTIAELNLQLGNEKVRFEILSEEAKMEKDQLASELQTCKEALRIAEQKIQQSTKRHENDVKELRKEIDDSRLSVKSVKKKSDEEFNRKILNLQEENKELLERLTSMKEEIDVHRLEAKQTLEKQLELLRVEYEETISQQTEEQKKKVKLLSQQLDSERNLTIQLKRNLKEYEVQLNSVVEVEEQNRDICAARLGPIRTEIEVLEKALKAKGEENEELKDDLNAQEKASSLKLTQLERNLKEAREKNKLLQLELMDLRTRDAEKNSKITDLEDSMSELKVRFRSKESLVKKLDYQKKELMTKLVDLEHGFEGAKSNIKSLEAELKSTQKRLYSEEQKLLIAQQQIESCNDEIAIIEHERRSDIKVLKEQYESAAAQSVNSQGPEWISQRETLNMPHEDERVICNQLRLELQSSKKESETIISKLTKSIENLKEKEDNLRREKRKFESEVLELQRHVDELDLQLALEKAKAQQMEQLKVRTDFERNQAEHGLKEVTQLLNALGNFPQIEPVEPITPNPKRSVEMNDEVDTVKAMVRNAINRNSSLAKEREEAEARLRLLQVQLKEQTLTIENLKASVDRQKDRDALSEEQLQGLQKELSNKDSEVAKALEELEAKDQNIALLEAQVASLQQACADKDKSARDLAQRDSIQQRDTERQVNETEEALRASEERILELRLQCKKQESEIERLQRQLESTQTQLKSHRERLESEVGNRVDRLETDLSRSRSSEEALRSRIHALHDELRNKERLLKASQDKQRLINDQLEQCQTEKKRLSNQLEKATFDREESDRRCHQLQLRLDSVREQLQHSESKINHLEFETVSKNAFNSVLNPESENQERELMKMRSELDKARRDNAELKQKADSYRREISSLRRQLSQIEERWRQERSNRRLLISNSIDRGRETSLLRCQLARSLSRVHSSENVGQALLQRESTHLQNSVNTHIKTPHKVMRRRAASVDRAAAIRMFSPIVRPGSSNSDFVSDKKTDEKMEKSALDRARRHLSFSNVERERGKSPNLQN